MNAFDYLIYALGFLMVGILIAWFLDNFGYLKKIQRFLKPTAAISLLVISFACFAFSVFTIYQTWKGSIEMQEAAFFLMIAGYLQASVFALFGIGAVLYSSYLRNA